MAKAAASNTTRVSGNMTNVPPPAPISRKSCTRRRGTQPSSTSTSTTRMSISTPGGKEGLICASTPFTAHSGRVNVLPVSAITLNTTPATISPMNATVVSTDSSMARAWPKRRCLRFARAGSGCWSGNGSGCCPLPSATFKRSCPFALIFCQAFIFCQTLPLSLPCAIYNAKNNNLPWQGAAHDHRRPDRP